MPLVGPQITVNIYSIMVLPPHDQRLQSLLSSPHLWRGEQHEPLLESPGGTRLTGIASGHTTLDAVLPWRGWPRSALVEIISPWWGAGEMQLILPLLHTMSRDRQWTLWIAPPLSPYAPGLMQAGIDPACNIVVTPAPSQLLWSLEKALQSRACALVLGWPGLLTGKHIRRLQLAARKGRTLGILFHQRNIRHSASVLRLGTETIEDSLQVHVLKARGSYRRDSVSIRLDPP